MHKFTQFLSIFFLIFFTGCSAIQTDTLPLPQVWSGTPIPPANEAISLENVKDIQEIARWGYGEISEIAWSPDGKQLAIGTSIGVFIYDSETLTQLQYIQTPFGVSSLSFSPDGTLLATGDSFPGDNTRLWEVDSGKVKRIFPGDAFTSSVSFSPDGTIIAIADGNERVRLWDVNRGKILREPAGYNGLLSSGYLTFSPDGKWLAVADWEKLRIWGTALTQPTKILTPEGGVRLVAFSGEGSLLASDACPGKDEHQRCLAGEVWIWDIKTEKPISVFHAHQGRIASLDISSDGKILVTGGSDDNKVIVWNVENQEIMTEFSGDNGPIISIAISPDNTRFVSGSRDGTVRVWSLKTGEQLDQLTGFYEATENLSLSQDGTQVIAGSNFGAYVWDVRTGTLMASQFQDMQPINWGGTLAIPVGQTQVAFNLTEGNISAWNFQSNQITSILTIPSWARDISYSPTNNLLAISLVENFETSDAFVVWWNLSQGRVIKWLPVHDQVSSLTFSEDGTLLATCFEKNNRIQIWEVASLNLSKELEGEVSAVSDAVFSPDGKLFAAVSDDKHVRIWDVLTGKLLHDLTGHTWWIFSVAFSSDGKLLATGARDQTIRLWDVASGKQVELIKGHAAGVTGLAFLPDNSYLISGSEDGTIRLWGIVK